MLFYLIPSLIRNYLPKDFRINKFPEMYEMVNFNPLNICFPE